MKEKGGSRVAPGDYLSPESPQGRKKMWLEMRGKSGSKGKKKT